MFKLFLLASITLCLTFMLSKRQLLNDFFECFVLFQAFCQGLDATTNYLGFVFEVIEFFFRPVFFILGILCRIITIIEE